MLTAAAGYVINDVYDVDIDNVNRPDSVIVGNKIRLRTAENFYIFLIVIAVSLGIFISYSINLHSLSMLIPVVAGLLYFYSTTYKGQVVIGNLMVAFFSGIIPIIVLLFELPLLKLRYAAFLKDSGFNLNFLIAWFGYYAIFAFLISLLREIIKDVEDFEGDTAYGKKTIPVTFGVLVSKVVSLVILSIIVFFEIFIITKYLHDTATVFYASVSLFIPSIYIGISIFWAKEKKDYSKISKWCKMIMVAGIIYTLVARFLVLN
jgi:4-hydroxybenzoate polyprenyltransferase